MARALAAVALVVLALAAALAFVRVGPLATGTSGSGPHAVTVSADGKPGICQETLVRAGTRIVDVAVEGRARRGGQVQLQDLQGVPQATSVAVEPISGGLRYTLDQELPENLGGLACVTAPAGTQLLGDPGRSGLRRSGVPAEGSLALTFRRGGSQSLASEVTLVAARIGRVRGAFGGAWRAVALLGLALAGLAAAVWTLRAALRGASGRRLALAAASVAVANSLAFGLLTPALQIPDEPAHLSYVQDLVEKGQAPRLADPALLSPELAAVIATTSMESINRNPAATPPWTAAEDQAIRAELAQPRSRVNEGSYPPVGDYPPLYYLALAPAYAGVTAAGGTTLDAITPLRALSSLLAGLTVLAVLAFALELFRGRWEVAVPLALICAYQPVLAWISGGVNPDGLFIALTTTLFWLLARGLNRGLTPRLAVATGLVLGAAVLTKATGLGLIPGVAVALGLVLWRRGGDRARVAAAWALGLGVPLALYAIVNVAVWDRPLLPGGVVQAASSLGADTREGGTGAFWTYLWQYALPRVGGMTDFIPGTWAVRDLWVPQWLGRFGWYDYGFPQRINDAALVAFAAVAVAAVVELVRRWRSEPLVRLHVLVYAVLAAGLLFAIARVGYGVRAGGAALFEQGRYVLPLIALYAAALGLAAGALGRRGAAALTLAFGLAVVHFAGALALTVSRYFV